MALISESCARAAFPNQDPIGKTHPVWCGREPTASPWLTNSGHRGRRSPVPSSISRAEHEAYIPLAQDNKGLLSSTWWRAPEGDPRRFEQTVRQGLSCSRPIPSLSIKSGPLEDYVAESQTERPVLPLIVACPIRRSGSGAGSCGNLWRDLLRGKPANTRAGHSHGPRRRTQGHRCNQFFAD